jgi:hypothetical protein
VTASDVSLQTLLYQLPKSASPYNVTISTAKTKTLALKGKDLIRAKIVINSNIVEKVTNCNFTGCQLLSNRNYDSQSKLKRTL